MTSEELYSKFIATFPHIPKAKSEVKPYLTLAVGAADLVEAAAWLREQGFDYLDIVTAVDYKGPVDARGYVTSPNPNAFLPEGATPQVEAPAAAPGFPYRDAFEAVYFFSSLAERLKVVLKVEVPRADPKVPSLAGLFKAADWQEREAFDLFGLRFEGHPNLTKILTPDFIQGHPLRKDYAHVADRFD